MKECLTSQEIVEMLRRGREGVETFNKIRQENPDWKPKIHSCHILPGYHAGLRLDKVNFCCADLSFCTFMGASLVEANFSEAQLCQVDFSTHDWQSYFDFGLANLTRANFKNAQCVNTDFSQICLADADFFEANVRGAIFTGADMSGVKNFLTTKEFERCILENALHIPKDVHEKYRSLL